VKKESKPTPRRPFRDDAFLAAEAGRRGGQASAESRRRKAAVRIASSGPWAGTIIDLMDAAGMRGAAWTPWRAFWKAVYALPMTTDELTVFQRHTARDVPPVHAVAEAWMCIGRGGGKTRNSALHAVFRAISFDQTRIAPGEDAIIPLLASTRRQASQGLKYVRAFNALPLVAPYVFRGDLRDSIEYRTGVNVEVIAAQKNAVRGYACPTCNADEIAWWENDDDHVNPDSEIITAVRGSLGRVKDSLLVVLSNPAAPKGELYDAVESYFGKADDDVIVWNADTLSMNPTYDQRTIRRAFAKDPVSAGSEFGSGGYVTFRQGKAALFDAEPITSAVVVDRYALAPVDGVPYVAFLDMAQGARSGDSAALGIAHREGQRAVLDVVRNIEPPFSPGDTIASVFVPLLRSYRIGEVRGDRHSVGFVREFLDGASIRFVPSELSKSQLYAELLALVNTGVVELLDDATLKHQLLGLQRRARRGGQDEIDHARGGHDDSANVAAGALVHVAGIGLKSKGSVMLVPSAARRNAEIDVLTEAQHKATQGAFLAKVAQRTLAHHAREDRIAQQLIDADERMVGLSDVVFRTHTSR
jgi:hypothetical protein